MKVCKSDSAWHAGGCGKLLSVDYELDGGAPTLLSVQVELGTQRATPGDVKLSLQVLSKGSINLGAITTY